MLVGWGTLAVPTGIVTVELGIVKSTNSMRPHALARHA